MTLLTRKEELRSFLRQIVLGHVVAREIMRVKITRAGSFLSM